MNAADLLLNGVGATGLSGSGASYTFSFPPVNATVIQVSWAANHGITDLATPANPFNAAGATWTYTTPDTVAPSFISVEPPQNITLRTLGEIRITFSEPVTGVSTNALLINNQPARAVSGSGAGPYTFSFPPPSNGVVQIVWPVSSGVYDLGNPPNPFAGAQWTYILDPNASFAGKVVINEVMFDPFDGNPNGEWVEFKNISPAAINLTGWQITRGVDFTFPNVSIAAGGYFVVAANLSVFQAQHPGVTNVVGNWTGQLANNGKTIELSTSLGETVNSVHYATEGDWAQRERGNGPSRVTSITRSGSTATVTVFSHGYTASDQIVITGANQPEYNGRFTLSSVGVSTFNITVSGAPTTPATGAIVCHQVVDDGTSGWGWFSPAAGFGASLELINPLVSNSSGENWGFSDTVGGTPGVANSAASTNIAPLIEDVTHTPAVPRSSDSVAITARVNDELSNGVQTVTLFYRNRTAAGTGSNPFSSATMLDDGAHADGTAGDHLYGAVLLPSGNGTVIEFYVQASDSGGRTRTWPAPAADINGPSGTFGTPGQYANALYQVDNEAITNSMPIIRAVMTTDDRAVLPRSSSETGSINRNSDAGMNCSLVSSDSQGSKVRYLCDTRIRGAGSRSRTPTNNRLNIPNDNSWNGRNAINLNSQFVPAQLLGNVVAAKAGLPTEEPYIVQYRINGVNPAKQSAAVNGTGTGDGWGVVLLLKPVDGDLAADVYPLDGNGNTYRASTGNHNADLNYLGTDPNSYLNRGVYKTSNKTENDWTDFINLTFALSQVSNPTDYQQAISTNINVQEWMTYFAISSLENDGETKLGNGIGDDYALYRGLGDKRFVIFAHDFDTVFGQGDTTNIYPVLPNSSIFIMLNPPNGNATPATLSGTSGVLRRFLNAYGPVFYGEVKRICDTILNPTTFNPLVDQYLTGWGVGPDATAIAGIKTFAAARRAAALSQIPLNLTVNSPLVTTSNGFPYTTSASLALNGASHAIDTRKVLVNGVTATWSGLDARWTNTVSLQPGINTIVIQSLDSNNVEFARSNFEVWYDDLTVQNVSGAIATDTTWAAANGPYNVTASVTVNSGVTLTIQPGTTIYLGSGVNITVANGGRLLAEGTEGARIRFTRAPGSATTWGGLTVNGSAGSPETRIAYARFEFNSSTAIHSSSGTLFLDHLTFGNPGVQYVSLDGSSFVVQNCVFPATTGSFEPVHGTAGIKAGGRGIVRRNFWGRVNGYNDMFDFTGGNRPGPILQVINNVFAGSDDDILDLDSTDAWVEGNIFLHCHRGSSSPDSSSAVSGGSDNTDNSQITIIGNIVYDCDQAANAKQTNFYTLLNNTIVHQSRVGSVDTNAAVVILADDTTPQGAGTYLEGNIISDAENLTRNVTTALVTYTNNLIYQLQGAAWNGPGGNNATGDPLFQHLPQLAETTNFNSWEAAQILKTWLSLRTGSPGIGTGPDGLDKGAIVPMGVTLSGVPLASGGSTATIRVGINRTGNGIPPAGFPNGSGYTHYKWRLDGGAWSAETPISTPITLSGLSAGQHYVEASGKRDSGFYQDDPVFGEDAIITRSRTWTVQPGAITLRLNEVLASNGGVVNHNGTTPDVIELYNESNQTLDLSSVRLTRDPGNPDKFIFPPGSSLPARSYLVLYANDPDGTPGYHLGFNLNQGGDSIYLFDSAENGGVLLDSLTFGPQLTDLSIGRLTDGSWTLTMPTFGSDNRTASLGDPAKLRINEWLAISQAPFDKPFIELYNLDSLPVNMGGLYLSDEPIGWPTRSPITPLSFIPANGYFRFLPDGDPQQGADHTDFHLSEDVGMLALYNTDLSLIDLVSYQPQKLNVSQGRSPNGTATIIYFDQPTPGAPNPTYSVAPQGNALVINEVLANNGSLAEVVGTNTVTPDWIELYNGTTTNISLADLSLTDDTLLARKYVFAPGTQLASGAYYRILCHSSLPTNASNTGFSLKSSGGAVYLFDSVANGGGLVSSIVYGLQTPDFSIARVPSGSTNWVLASPTPGTANTALPSLGDPANLKVNEWMADPLAGNSDWFEIYNPSTLPVALGGLWLTDDLNARTRHQIAALSFIGYGTNAYIRFEADNNPSAGADHVGFSLKNSGEAVGLSRVAGDLIDGVTFGVQDTGVSEGRFPDGSTNIVRFPQTDSPGQSNYRLLTSVVINEVLTHTDEPLEDAIELRNLTGQAIDLSGWWLSDDKGALRKYQIPFGTNLPANGFIVIYETHFTNRVEAAIPFALSSSGDEVVLSAATNGALTGYRTSVKFGAANNGVSFGRYLTSDGKEEFVSLSARTFGVDDPGSVQQFRQGTGLPNAYPRVGPVVISQIMYHPPDLGTNDNGRDEYVQLRNITTAPVPFYDPLAPTNVWHLRNAVDYDFPTGLTLAPGGTLLVVGFDPVNNPTALSAFRSVYGLSTNTVILGPWVGKLANDTESIELRRPDAPNIDDVPYVLLERVKYSDLPPWPTAADASGLSLHRVSDTGFGNDATNWVAAAPNLEPQGSSLDSDGDGIPNAWESAYGFDPYNPADASQDADGDGLTNLQEYRIGSDPRDAHSGLGLSVSVNGGNVLLTFTAYSNMTFTVEYTDVLGSGVWHTLQNVDAAATNQTIQISVPAAGPARFYRLRTPWVLGQASLLQINSIQLAASPGQALLNFTIGPNLGCIVEQTPNLEVPAWSTVTNYSSAAVSRTLQISVPMQGTAGFYRLRSS